VGRTIQATKEAFMPLETSARKMGLAVNEEKTKFMEVGKKLTTVAHFTVGNYKFEKVHLFKYLGSLVKDKNDISVEIKNRIGPGNKCYCVWLRSGRPGDRGSIPDRSKGFFL
jgi:hypothetical protein